MLHINKIITSFTIIAFTVVLALVMPIDVAVAQTSNAMPDGDREYNDRERKEGKSYPCKEGKSYPCKEGKMNSIKQMM